MASQPIPIIATGTVYAAYIAAARTNYENLLRLAQGLKDDEFATVAQRLLDDHDASATEALFLIAEADPAPEYVERVSFGMHHPDSPAFGRGF